MIPPRVRPPAVLADYPLVFGGVVHGGLFYSLRSGAASCSVRSINGRVSSAHKLDTHLGGRYACWPLAAFILSDTLPEVFAKQYGADFLLLACCWQGALSAIPPVSLEPLPGFT